MKDAERIAAILAALPQDDAAFLRAQLKAHNGRAARLPQRDAAVQEALAAHAALARKPAAQALAAELRRIPATPQARGDRPELLRKILALSDTGTLGWRRIFDIGEVQRSPGTLHRSESTQHA